MQPYLVAYTMQFSSLYLLIMSCLCDNYMLYTIVQVYTKSLQSPHCTNIHRDLFIECLCDFVPGEEGDKTRSVVQCNYQSYYSSTL